MRGLAIQVRPESLPRKGGGLMPVTWKHRRPVDALAYEQMRVSLLTNRETLDWGGCVCESWWCADLPGLEVVKLQANPEQPLSCARWAYVARHWIDLPDEQFLENICTADTFDEARAAAERYLVAHVGFAFTVRFRSEYFYDIEHAPKAVH